jgi:flagellar motor protein MotB
MATQHYAAHAEDEESYFVSMTDVVIGLLFIFIIMLMFFAMRFQQATQTQNEVNREQIEVNREQIEVNRQQSQATEGLREVTRKQDALINDLTDAENARSEILEKIGSALQKEGINVIIVKDEGILRLPEDILFEPSRWEIKATARGVDPIKTLSKALDQVLPCYTHGLRSRENDCPTTKAKVDAIFIEGHADSDRFRSPPAAVPASPRRPSGTSTNPPTQGEKSGSILSFINPATSPSTPSAQRPRPPSISRVTFPPKDNLDLSALRATSTYRELLRVQPELSQYLSPNNTPILSVSGYGEYRPLAREPNESLERFKQRNRRIDLRILMATVRSEDAKRMQQDLKRFEIRP